MFTFCFVYANYASIFALKMKNCKTSPFSKQRPFLFSVQAPTPLTPKTAFFFAVTSNLCNHITLFTFGEMTFDNIC